MGCCVSSDKSHRHFPQSPSLTHEEETVKEVLSETPISKPLSPLMIFQEKMEIEAMAATADEVCQVSEVSAVYSEGFSTTSFKEKNEYEVNIHDDDDGDGEVTRMVGRSPSRNRRRRPCSGDVSGGKERGGWGPPRRSDSPPECLNRVPSRTVRAPEACRRNGVIPGVGKSCRRSRSPATVSEGGAVRPVRGKSPPSITSGQYSHRLPAATAEKGCAFEKSNGGDSPTGNETLENPLVSLECFIFL